MLGCNNLMTPSAKNKIPADLIQQCPPLQTLSGTTGKEVLPWALQIVHQYNDCKQRHSALIQAVSP